MTRQPSLADIDAGAAQVVATLRAAGHRALLAGGCVRDLLLGRRPADWDVATDAAPEQVQALFPRTVAVGARFGIVAVVLEAGGRTVTYEVARFRSEGPYSDGRRPDHVEFATPEADARRRDFTVNGMFLDLAALAAGTDGVVDHVGGRADLAARTIRAIGDPAARFAEDGLRTLRAIRFATRLDFEIETQTWRALAAAAAAIDRISAERVRDELTAILTGGGAARGLDLLDASGLLTRLLPEVTAMHGVPQPPEHHPEGDVWTHVRRMLEAVDALEAPSPTLAWSVLLHDIGKPGTFRSAEATGDRIRFHGHDELGAEMADAVGRRLRFANDTRERVRELTAQHMRFGNVRRMRPAKLKRFLRQELFGELLELHRIDCLGSHAQLDLYEFCRQKLAEADAEGQAEALRPEPLLRGHDLIAVGYPPGPRLGQILRWVEDEQLEGRLADRAQALAAVRARWRPEGDDGAGSDAEA